MADYGDHLKDQRQADFIKRWEPEEGYPEEWNYQTRWLCARARSAEHDLRELRAAVRVIDRALRDR